MSGFVSLIIAIVLVIVVLFVVRFLSRLMMEHGGMALMIVHDIIAVVLGAGALVVSCYMYSVEDGAWGMICWYFLLVFTSIYWYNSWIRSQNIGFFRVIWSSIVFAAIVTLIAALIGVFAGGYAWIVSIVYLVWLIFDIVRYLVRNR
ncbi:MAG: hypothetical protein LUE27_01205 [Clostridia bacterium]|nr:hypothetical protein [Clostridia bacterium]